MTNSAPFVSVPSPVLIAGVVAPFLVVLLLLLSLVGGVLAVVVKVKRKKVKETVPSKFKVEDQPPIVEGATDTIKMYEPTAASHDADNAYDYATTDDAFKNPASATASFNTNVYDSADIGEVDQMPSDAGERLHYEDARNGEKWDARGNENPVKSGSGEQMKSNAKTASTKVMKSGELYTQPNKMKKKNKRKTRKDSEANAAPCDDLYAKPDMTKKKAKRSQQHWEQESEERKLVPTPPLPYEKYKEPENTTEEDEKDIPEVPLPYVPDEELYYNTRGGSLPQDGHYDYALVDRQQK